MISENPRTTREMLAESLGISSRMVAKHIKTLQEQGILKRIGGRNTVPVHGNYNFTIK